MSLYHSLFMLLSCCSLLMRPVWCRIRRSFASDCLIVFLLFFFNYISILLQEICVWLRREKGNFSLILFFLSLTTISASVKSHKTQAPRQVRLGPSRIFQSFPLSSPSVLFYIDTCQTHIHLFGVNI